MSAQAKDTAGLVVGYAKELGASLAGVVDLEELSSSPSYVVQARMQPFDGVGSAEWAESEAEPSDPDPPALGGGVWPPSARSAAVIGLAHPSTEPDLDWWGVRGGTTGNLKLIEITAELKEVLAKDLGMAAWDASYYPDKGGVFLKDAAVLAGLGVIGRNNLVVTPEFGPRVRWRALFLDAALPSTGPLAFAPCDGCPAPCRSGCPQTAFGQVRYSPAEFGSPALPGTDGTYDRELCNEQMTIDEERSAAADHARAGALVRYCRRCELRCPAGRDR